MSAPGRLGVLGVVLVAAALGGLVWLRLIRPESEERVPRDAPQPSASTEPHEPSEAVSAVDESPRPLHERRTASVRAESADEESAQMKRLRGLVETDPSEAIALARELGTRFPTSGRASEREWDIVKALVNLKHFHEARDLARTMVEQYPGDPWAADVERHLLVYPLDQPSREEMQRRAEERER